MTQILKCTEKIHTTEILKFVEKIHAEFPQVPTNRMIEIWFKQQNIPKNSEPCRCCRTLHRNRKDNYCHDCRGGILKFGKYKNKYLDTFYIIIFVIVNGLIKQMK